MNSRLPLRENDVTKSIVSFLEWRQWRAIRKQTFGITTPQGRYLPIGEQGQPDWMFVYYLDPPGHSLTMWVEMKSPQDRRKCPTWCRNRSFKSTKLCTPCGQALWRAEEERRGALVVQADNFEQFECWYLSTFSWLHDPATAPKRGIQTALPLLRGP
jgi:hypothetical protein